MSSRRVIAKLGIKLPVPVERAAKMVLALDHGTGLLGIADPVGYPESFFFEVMGDLQEAMVALAERKAAGNVPAVSAAKPARRRTRRS